jgi:hypothetical protein
MIGIEQSAAIAQPSRAMEYGVWIGAALAAVLAASIYFLTHQAPPDEQPAAPFAVTATANDNRIRLSWSPDLPQVRAATGATLEVRDGDKSANYPVNVKVLKHGSLDYERNSDDVRLSLVLLDNGRRVTQSVVRVVEPEGIRAPVQAPPVTSSVTAQPAKPAAKHVVKSKKKPAKKPAKKRFQFVPHY